MGNCIHCFQMSDASLGLLCPRSNRLPRPLLHWCGWAFSHGGEKQFQAEWPIVCATLKLSQTTKNHTQTGKALWAGKWHPTQATKNWKHINFVIIKPDLFCPYLLVVLEMSSQTWMSVQDLHILFWKEWELSETFQKASWECTTKH